MAPPILTANVTISNSGANTIVTNPFKTVAQAQTHGQQRGAVIRVLSFLIQNQNTTSNVNASWQDSSSNVIEGPCTIPTSFGNWTERASFPSFLFETTRSNSNGVGYDLQVNLNLAQTCQVFCEYMVTFAPGRAGA